MVGLILSPVSVSTYYMFKIVAFIFIHHAFFKALPEKVRKSQKMHKA
jgi:hypothetical protein